MNNLKKIVFFLMSSLLFSVMTYGMEKEFPSKNKRQKTEEEFIPQKITLYNALPLDISIAWYYANTNTKMMERVGDVHQLQTGKECELKCPKTKTETASWRIITKMVQSITTTLGGWNVGFDRQIIISFASSTYLKETISFDELEKNKFLVKAKSFKDSNWVEWAKRGIFHIIKVQSGKEESSIEIVSGGFVKLINNYYLSIYARVYDKNKRQFFGEVITIDPISSASSYLVALPSGLHAKGRSLVFAKNPEILTNLPLENSDELTIIQIPYQILTIRSPEQNKIEGTYYINEDVENKNFTVNKDTLTPLEESEQTIETARSELDVARFSNNHGEIAEKEWNLCKAENEHIGKLIEKARKSKDYEEERKLNNNRSIILAKVRALSARIEFLKALEKNEHTKAHYFEKDMEMKDCQVKITENSVKIKDTLDEEEKTSLIKENEELAKIIAHLEKEIKHAHEKLQKEQQENQGKENGYEDEN